MISIILLSLVSGFSTKFVDEVADRKLITNPSFPVISAILYGITGAYLSLTTQLSSLFLALVIAMILSSKINHKFHILGVVTYAILILFFPINSFNPYIFSVLFVSALLDELDISINALKYFTDYRLLTPLIALFIFLWSGNAIFIIAIASFDIAYKFCEKMLN